MARAKLKILTHDDYGVAIICPLEVEMSAVRYMLDEEHARLPNKEGDSNRYICGQMSGHNVVVAYLPQGSQGVGAAAVVATDVKRSFPHASLRLLVGIGGGVPSRNNDVRLGDVVVSMPTGVHGGVVQYDLGKDTVTGFERKGFLEPPPAHWRTCVVEMQSDHRVKDNQITIFIDEMISKYPNLVEYSRPAAEKDMLFLPNSEHMLGEPTCEKCDHSQQVNRPSRTKTTPKIFYGLVASGNRVQKNAELRDKIAQDAGGALCFEMEAAGLMNDFRCIVIRGISDYADSHKNDDWHAYGAAVAAGCVKELLSYMDPVQGTLGFGRNQHWTVSRATNPHFTGRTELVTEIEGVVWNTLQDNARTDQCRIVITGMGGQGKSEMCLHVANRILSRFWGVFWVDVSTTASAESGFLTIASRLNQSASTVDDVCQHLANVTHPWLLILDNADSRDVDYQQYFPSGSAGVIMLTSRNRECHEYATHPAISLDGLPPRDACLLLLKTARIASSPSSSQGGHLQEHLDSVAVSLLDGHPLALIQAGTYISQGHCSIAQYRQVFERQRKRLLTFRPKQAQSRYRDVYATFEASAEILQSSPEEAASDALQLLSVLSMLASSPLPLSLFEAAWEGAQDVLRRARIDTDDHNGSDHNLSQLVPWHAAQLLPLLNTEGEAWDSFRLVEAVRLLEAYSLVFITSNNSSMSVSMHPLTHAWAKDRQQATIQQQSWLRAGCIVAVSSYQTNLWQKQQPLRPHLPALVSMDARMMLESGPQLMIVRVLLRIGLLLDRLRIDKELFVLCQQMFRWLGLDSKNVNERWLPLYELAGQNLRNHGQTREATTVLQQIVRISEQTLAEDHPSRLDSQYALAIAYRENGQVQQAVTLLEQVIRIEEQTLAEDHPDRLASQHVLAIVYQANGQVQQAVTLLEQVVRIREQTQAEDHPDRLASQHALAMAYRDNGQVQQAVTLLEQVVRIEERTLAEDHPNRLASQQVLATTLWKIKQFSKAFQMMQHVVELRRRMSDESHPDRKAAEQWLAHMGSQIRQC